MEIFGASKIVSSMMNCKEMIVGATKKAKRIGTEDPMRIYHSLKVGLALTLVSIFYYVNPIYDGFGVSAMWAVLTVVVVMEYAVGGTLSKCMNRSFATVIAGALGLGAHYLAILSGERGEPIVLGVLVFLLATAATFTRFVPEIKKRYDYGVMIFILTFSLVAVSSYRTEDMIRMAEQRLSTVVIGVSCCICTSIFVFPVWAGEDLHKQAVSNLNNLASFLEGLVSNNLGEKDKLEKLEDKLFLGVHKSLLNSKATEEALANFAKWEPGHGQFSFLHPWSQYLKIGSLARQCAYSMDTLATYITACPKIHVTHSEFHTSIRNASMEMASESSKALTEMATAIRTMRSPSAARSHLAAAMQAADRARAALSEEDGAVIIPDILPSAITTSLLIQVVDCVRQTSMAVEELAKQAQFKALPEVAHKAATVKLDVECPNLVVEAAKLQVAQVECAHVVIAVKE